MDTSRAIPKSSDRWFLHVQGRTLGPLASEEVAFGLKTGEFLPGDKIANSRHPIWRRLSEHPFFGRHAGAENTPRSALLKAPPSPRLLRVKPVVPPKVPEVVPERPATEELKAEAMQPQPAILTAVPIQEPVPEATLEPKLEPEPEPELKPISSSEPAGARAFHPSLSAETGLLEEDPETNAALEAATLELERALSKLSQPAPSPAPTPAARAEVSSPIPPRPEVPAIFLTDPSPARRAAAPRPARQRRVIQLELKVPEKPLRWALAAMLVFSIAYFAGSFWRKESPAGSEGNLATEQLPPGADGARAPGTENKTRDLEKFPLPDPSSPTNTPTEAGDPVPRLKAPTRPRRD